MLPITLASDDWNMMLQLVDVSLFSLIGRKVIGRRTPSTAFRRFAAATRTAVVDCELERVRSVSQLCGLPGTSLSRCLAFSRHSTSLPEAACQF